MKEKNCVIVVLDTGKKEKYEMGSCCTDQLKRQIVEQGKQR